MYNTEGYRTQFWSAVYSTTEQEDIGGSAFWWYPDRMVDTNFGIMEGYPELSVFQSHSQTMASKSGSSPTPTATPTPVSTATPTPTPTLPSQPEKGDVNSDTSINIVDALLVAQYYVGLITGFC